MRPHPNAVVRPGAIALVATLALALLAMGCEVGIGSRGGSDDPRYRFSRTQEELIRLDTAEGQVWIAEHSGDGGWRAVGGRPDDAGMPDVEGRYVIQSLTRRPSRRQPKPPTRLLRFDRATGRSWLIELGEDSVWTAIAEPAGRETPQDGPGGVATVAIRETPSATPEAQAEAPAEAPRRESKVVPREQFGATPEARQKNAMLILSAASRENVPIEMKIWGARQLGVLEPEIAVPPLLALLEHDDPEVVVAAIESLHQIGQPSTIPEILALGNHPDPRVRAAVAGAVQEAR